MQYPVAPPMARPHAGKPSSPMTGSRPALASPGNRSLYGCGEGCVAIQWAAMSLRRATQTSGKPPR